MTNERIKNKIYANLLIVIAIFAVFYLFILPQYKGSGLIYNPDKNISSLTTQKKDYDTTLSLANNYLETLNKTNTSYTSALAGLPIDKLNKVLPASADPIIVIYELTKMAARPESDMKIKSPQISDNNKDGNNNANRFNTMAISFSVEGTYEQLKAFLKNLESSERIYNVTSLSFNSSRDTRQSSILSYNLSIETYYLK